jgi:two-component system nitrogen regulation sensor histidine kinase NtrY
MAGWVSLWLGGIAGTAIAATCAALAWIESDAMAAVVAALVLTPLVATAATIVTRRWSATARALGDGILSIKDRDFSTSVTRASSDELGDLVDAFNSLGDKLRVERQTLYQRELMLDTVIQATPLALVLTNDTNAVLYSNTNARQLFGGGRKLEGERFGRYLDAAPAALQEAVQRGGDTLFTLELGGEPQVYHVSQRRFLLNALPHRLLLLKQLTREINSQEVATWKKVIRVIAHELNNSLAPISSLAHSGRLTVERPDAAQLERIFRTIEDRAKHLHSFIDGYARFAKLPRPQPEEIDWPAFLRSLQETAPFNIASAPPTRLGVFDPAQIEQVIINLVKNAKEAGAPPDSIELQVQEHAAGWRLQVLDRGAGMSEEVLRNALLPFYSTKPSGAGLGLTLCREVIEAHGGRISLANRPGGGLVATLWIPAITLD